MTIREPFPVGSVAARVGLVTAPAAGTETTPHPVTFKRGALTLDHLDDQGTCDCMCDRCTVERDGSDGGPLSECICPDCDAKACGLHFEVQTLPSEVSS